MFGVERRTETCSVDAGQFVPTIPQRFKELAQTAAPNVGNRREVYIKGPTERRKSVNSGIRVLP